MKSLRDIVLIYLPCLFLVGSFSWVMAYKFVPVRWTPLMLKRQIENASQDDYRRQQIWVSKEDISPLLIDAVLLAEDQRFYQHKGFDVIELKSMTRAYRQGESSLRGCSTISQQVAKNCFTFGGRSWCPGCTRLRIPRRQVRASWRGPESICMQKTNGP